MWGHSIWMSGDWGCAWYKIHYELYTSVGWHSRQLFWKTSGKSRTTGISSRSGRGSTFKECNWVLELGEVYLIVWPEGWVSFTDLALQSRTSFCLDNQSIPKITSMSEDLRAISEARNTKPSIATSFS